MLLFQNQLFSLITLMITIMCLEMMNKATVPVTNFVMTCLSKRHASVPYGNKAYYFQNKNENAVT